MRAQFYDHGLMVKENKPPPPGISDDLHFGPWIAFLGRKPSEVARGTNINEGYLSQLISGEKQNPSYKHVKRIADELGIPIDALRRLPPDRHHPAPVNPWPTLFSLFINQRRNDTE